MSKRPTARDPVTRPEQRPKSNQLPKPRQLRGEGLKTRIEDAVREHVRDLGGRIDPKRVSMKAIAERVPCSRTTLLKYETVVADALRDLGYRAARRSGQARTEALAYREELHKKEIAVLKAELAALRSHHAELYGRFLMQSAPVAALVHDDAVAFSQRDGRCILCGGLPPSSERANLVDLSTTTLGSNTRKRT